MAKAGYSVMTGGAVSLVAATAKVVLGVAAGSDCGLDLVRVWWGFTGTDATHTPATCELLYCTWATNGPGTNSTTVTPVQTYGRSIAVDFTAAKNWTSAPTVVTVIGEVPLSPNGGTVLYDGSLGQTPDCGPGHGFALRFTAADNVDVRATMGLERL